MLLESLFSYIPDSVDIRVFDYDFSDDDDEYLAEYNGRDSIPEEYNTWKVVEIRPGGDGRRIDVYIRPYITIPSVLRQQEKENLNEG